jgi:Ca2+/Na+ antiporter
MVTFFSCCAWLGVFVFYMIQWAEKVGCMIGISPAVMGLTVCAAGTSAPEAFSSFEVARKGKGSMAVFNVFGSNIFDILFGLGFPWMLKTTFWYGEVIKVDKDDIGASIMWLVGLLIMYLLSLAAGRMNETYHTGYLYLFIYLLFIIWCFLRDYGEF